jgi:hypothetical protein
LGVSTLININISIIGLTSYASLDSIYCETGWEKLTVRREVKKLNLFYKIINNEAPEYLSELIPPTVAESNNKLEPFFECEKGWNFSNI